MWGRSKDPERKPKTIYDIVLASFALLVVGLFYVNVEGLFSYAKREGVAVLYALAICLIIAGVMAFMNRLFLTSIIMVISLFALGAYDGHNTGVLIWGNATSIKDWIAFIAAIVGICFLAVRMENQNRQVEIQTRQLEVQTEGLKNQSEQVEIAKRQAEIQAEQTQIQAKQLEIQSEQNLAQMFNTAIALLGGVDTSARTGAIHSLYDFALKNETYRVQIAQIFCSHIRSKTREKAYQEEHKHAPSNEIQTTIDLLFKGRGLYCEFKAGLPRADLSNAHLMGVNFRGAHCEGAYFTDAHCEGAIFNYAYCEGSNFRKTHCEGADFYETHCEGAEFNHAHCEGVNFMHAHCEGTDFGYAHCEGAHFTWSYCQGAKFGSSHCQGACFTGAFCQGAMFSHAGFRGAYADACIVNQKLADRLGKNTELNDMIISGEFARGAIDNIEKAKESAGELLPENWYSDMQKLIDENKGKPIVRRKPDWIKEGKLEDSDGRLGLLVKKLQEIEKWKQNP